MRNIVVGAIAVVAVVLGLSIIFGSWYTVDQGEEAVLLSTGALTGTEGPGLHFKIPFVQSVEKISLQSHSEVYDSMESYSKDQQPAVISVSVNYHVPPGQSGALYAEYGSVDNLLARVIDQKVPAIFKNVFGIYDAQSAIQQRSKLNSDVLAALQSGISAPVVIESVQIKDIKFSPDYEAAIAAKQTATVEVLHQQQLLAQEQVKAQIVATTAKGAADAAIAQATGSAQAVTLAADAEAHAIQVKGDAEAAVIAQRAKALAGNPEVVALIQAEKWNGVLPTTMVPGSSVPFVSVR